MLVLSSTQISHHLPYIFYWRAHQNLRFKTSKPYLTIYFLQERFLSGHSLCPIVSDSNFPSFVSPPSISERLSYFHKVTQLVSYEFSFKWIIPLHCAFHFISYSEVKSQQDLVSTLEGPIIKFREYYCKKKIMILRRHLKIIYVPSYLPVIINKGLYHDYRKFFFWTLQKYLCSKYWTEYPFYCPLKQSSLKNETKLV